MSDQIHRQRRKTDIAYWLKIPEEMIVARNECTRWLEIRCTHWSPLGLTMSEAYMFRISMPNADEFKYIVKFQWDEGTEQTMGISLTDIASDRTTGKALWDLNSTQAIIHVYMDSNDILYYKNHMQESRWINHSRPQLTDAIDILMEFLESEIKHALEKQAAELALQAGQVPSNISAETANILTPIRDFMDKIFLKIAGGDRYEPTTLKSSDTYVDEIARNQQSFLNDVAICSHDSFLVYQNWIYANLRYMLRERLQIIYRRHTRQTR